MEHLSNDHEDHPNQHENSHKSRDETNCLKLYNIDPDLDFLDKGLEIVSLGHFVYNFSTKMFLMLYSIN